MAEIDSKTFSFIWPSVCKGTSQDIGLDWRLCQSETSRVKTMRLLLLGTAAIALSGCSFLGLGGKKQTTQYNPQTGYYGQQHTTAAPKSNCHSGNCLARWNLEGGIGPSFAVGKNIITSSRTNDVAGTDFNSISFNDAFETGVRAELGGSYAVSPNTKVSLLGHYEQADSDGAQNWGTINGEELTGSLSDYEAWGAELGLRQYFQPMNGVILNSVRPYVEARGGVSRINDIGVANTQLGGATFSAAEIPLYKDSWVGTAAGLVGVETPLTKYSTIGLETGIRYQGGLKSDKSVLGAGTQLGGLNNNRGRVSVPLTLRGRYRF